MAMRSKRGNIKAAAMDLFKRFGLKKVTIKEICENAQASKVTFYKHFRDKSELIFEILDEMHREGMESILTIWESETDIKEKFRELIRLKIHYYEVLGDNFVNDLLNYKDIQVYNMKLVHQNLKCMRNFIQSEQKKGNIRQDLSVDFILAIFSKSFDLMKDPMFHKVYPDPKELVNAIIEIFVFGVVNEK